MFDKIKSSLLQNVHSVDVLFGFLWLYGWFHNAELSAKYDLTALTTFFGVVRASILADRVNDSVNNSENFKPPGGKIL
jgi:hypothetical protein